MTEFGKWSWCDDCKTLEAYPRKGCTAKMPNRVVVKFGKIRCASCPRFVSPEFADFYGGGGFCCAKCYHGTGSKPHQIDCEIRAKEEGTTCEDEGCEYRFKPHSHPPEKFTHVFKMPTLPSFPPGGLDLDSVDLTKLFRFGCGISEMSIGFDPAGILGDSTVVTLLYGDPAHYMDEETANQLKKARRKAIRRKLKKRNPEKTVNWKAYAAKDKETRRRAEVERTIRDRKRQTYNVGGQTHSIPAVLPGEPIRDAECFQCGATWVEPVYVSTVYCPRSRHHMGYNYKKSPHRHCWEKIPVGALRNCASAKQQPHNTCCECGFERLDVQVEVKVTGREVIPDLAQVVRDIGESARVMEEVAFEETRLGGLHKVVQIGLEQNEMIENFRRQVNQLHESANNHSHGRRWLASFIEDQMAEFRKNRFTPFGVIETLQKILDKVRNLDFTKHPEFK